MILILWNKPEVSTLELIPLFGNLTLLHCILNLCCLENTVCQFMVVSCGAQWEYFYNKLWDAYNDGFGHLLNEPRWCNASKLFVFNNVLVYAAVIHKLIYSLWNTVFNSKNVLLCGLVNSDLYVHSPLFNRWRSDDCEMTWWHDMILCNL